MQLLTNATCLFASDSSRSVSPLMFSLRTSPTFTLTLTQSHSLSLQLSFLAGSCTHTHPRTHILTPQDFAGCQCEANQSLCTPLNIPPRTEVLNTTKKHIICLGSVQNKTYFSTPLFFVIFCQHENNYF